MQGLVNYFNMVRGLNRSARLFLVHTMLSGLAIALLALLYNFYIASLGFKQDMIGLVTLVACTVAVVAALPMGFVLNRLGYKRALVLAILLTTFSMVLPLVFPTADALIGCELFWGVGFTLLIIAGGPFMTENSTTEQRPHLFSLQFVLTTVTAFAGNLLGGELPRWFGNLRGVGAEAPQAYQLALAVSVVLMLSSVIPIFFLSQGNTKHPSAVRPHLHLNDRAGATKLLLPYIIGALGAGMFVPFVNVLWKMTQNVSDATIGTIFAFSALVMAVFGLASPVLAQRFGTVRVMVVAQGLAVIGLVAFGMTPIFGIALVGYLARDVLMNMTRPLYSQFMMEMSEPGERAAVSAFATMGFNLAWGVSSWVSGMWQTQNQLAWVFATSAGFFLVSAFSLYWFFGRASNKKIVSTATRALVAPAE